MLLVTALAFIAGCGDDDSDVVVGDPQTVPVESTTTTLAEAVTASIEPDVATPDGATACGAATLYVVPGTAPASVAPGADGSVWFTAPEAESIGHLTLDGTVSLYPLPAGNSPMDIASDGAGTIWFTFERPPGVGRMTADGEMAIFPVPTTDGYIGLTPEEASSFPTAITLGPDGAMWFLETGADQLGRVAADGSITEIALPERERIHTHPFDLAVGPDGAIWYTAPLLRPGLGRYDITTGAFTEFEVPTVGNSGVKPGQLALGPDGSFWHEQPHLPGFGRMSTDGAIEYVPFEPMGDISALNPGPEGVWFTLAQSGIVGRIDAEGNGVLWALPPEAVGIGYGRSNQITHSPDGSMWFALPDGNRLGRIPCG